MSSQVPPALTVRYGNTERTFAAVNDVVIGRDLRADLRIADPLVSRRHLILRFVHPGGWVAIDNGSLNGIFATGRGVSSVEIRQHRHVNVGGTEGPLLTFELDRRAGIAGRPPQTAPQPDTAAWTTLLAPQVGREPVTAVTTGRTFDASKLATSMMKALRPNRSATAPVGSITVGRATDNDVVIADVLASRYHATLAPGPGGAEIHDRSINGTFVNGVRVKQAPISDGDVVTIGNVDLVYANGTLVRRTEAESATQTGGLDVRGVTWTIESNKTLLDDISLTARPGTLTAVIGPSGAGKSTFARLVGGYTQPTAGTVTFEGHNVHAEYANLRSRIGMVPQDDVVHGQLTVQQALMYAAELRLPPDSTTEDREQIVAQVLEELEMAPHAGTRVDKLSGGQRKRASVALELLTGPSLLILDEPTSGLDPALDRQILVLLNVGAVFMGTALTVRDLIGERAIFRREQAVGLSTTAYLLAKVCVYTTFAVIQSAIVTTIVVMGKGGPTHGAVVVGSPTVELFVDIAATCVASAMLGLALSALASSNEQIMPLLVVAVMSQLVFSGGMIPVTGRVVFDQMSWITPARWGFAASASTVDLIDLVPGPLTPKDAHWEHTRDAWLFDMAMLAAISAFYVGFVRWRIRLTR
ncbi:hypothetical protein BH11ACT6_BH11ACT6_17570 [soil metagenome]